MRQPYYRLGLDIGTNSIGWALIRLNENNEPSGILNAGARIYSDGRKPKDKTSLATDRRTARSARRRRDRYLRRRRKLLSRLTKHELMPVNEKDRDKIFDPAQHDPYEIRARGLDEELSLYELGRALYHLNQRRGFQSNRKSEKGDEKESGKIKSAVNRLRTAIEGADARTLGEYLHKRKIKNQPVRVRMTVLSVDEKGKDVEGYDFYPDRALVSEEFQALWQKQAEYHPEQLTEDAKADIADAIFFQRPLRPVRPGKCTFNPEEERLPRAHPLYQRLRIYQDINHLRVIGPDLKERPPLSKENRDKAVYALLNLPKRTFNQLRKLLSLPPDTSFNRETENCRHLEGDLTADALSKDKCFGKSWRRLSSQRQAEVVDRLLNDQDEEELVAWLMAEFALSESQAQATAAAPLPDGYGALGLTASSEILEELEREVIPYSKACEKADYHHSDFRTGEILEELPYYAHILERHVAFGTGNPEDSEETRYGKVANPTVHIGLNQLRRILNSLIREYGKPSQITVELARELKQNKKQKDRTNKTLRENTERAQRHANLLKELDYPNNGENRMRLRLWEELNPSDPENRRCPYTLEQIGIRMLFTAEVDIDHILPFSRTLDNSAANRTVCMAHANRGKGKQTPAEFLRSSPRWEAILDNAQNLPGNKRWRFAEDAMERFEADRDFLDRHITDTQYLSRIAGEYLKALYPEKGESRVWVTPGRLTAMLRRFWGFDSILRGHNTEDPEDPEKNRLDHRHHAIDAIVVGLTDRGLLARIAREAARSEDLDNHRLLAEVPQPWPTVLEDVAPIVRGITVSHRQDHKSSRGYGRDAGRNQTSGQLHNDTAYGIISEPDKKGIQEVVHRVDFTSFKTPEELEAIRDNHLRSEVIKATKGLSGDAFKAALVRFASDHPTFRGIRHVRIVERLSVVPVKDKTGRIYKAYKGDSNDRFDVWELPDGTWTGEAVSTFVVNQPDYVSPIRAEHETAKKVLSLKRNDMIAREEQNGETGLLRVVKFSTNGSMQLAPPHESGNLKSRDKDNSDDFKYINTSASGLKKHKARQVRVDELGRVWDPGPRG